MDSKMFKKRAELLAQRLAGRPVEIRWQHPPYAEALGCAIKTRDGEAVAYITPTWDEPNKVYRTYLHEMAHLRLHWDVMPKTNHADQPSGSMAGGGSTQLGNIIHRPIEDEADALKADWMAHAENNTWRPSDPNECLKALMDWLPTEFKAAIEKAVTHALEKALKGKSK